MNLSVHLRNTVMNLTTQGSISTTKTTEALRFRYFGAYCFQFVKDNDDLKSTFKLL